MFPNILNQIPFEAATFEVGAAWPSASIYGRAREKNARNANSCFILLQRLLKRSSVSERSRHELSVSYNNEILSLLSEGHYFRNFNPILPGWGGGGGGGGGG